MCTTFLPAYSNAKIITIERVFPELWCQMYCHVFFGTQCTKFDRYLSSIVYCGAAVLLPWGNPFAPNPGEAMEYVFSLQSVCLQVLSKFDLLESGFNKATCLQNRLWMYAILTCSHSETEDYKHQWYGDKMQLQNHTYIHKINLDVPLTRNWC